MATTTGRELTAEERAELAVITHAIHATQDVAMKVDVIGEKQSVALREAAMNWLTQLYALRESILGAADGD